ncbi:zonular occludens toxin domain-containing protein [Arsukibacterium indicum]|uniref:Zona occludens toxin N-terminal domain-containing protein n=1 Tax=Arsukibacterium indicum TaxID=2848612 RepID=A0ABS6MMR7_9GAMM|nr:zonular occludens toxin domain-containing protein [Arsukibacterium indicum]MBV2129870.1 hypothetical protein [Arsukibacterium indicum]
MLYLRTGLPGASKTLNTLREITHDTKTAGREIYYHNIKLLLLDFEVCHSFQGYFYGVYLPSLNKSAIKPVQKRLQKIHGDGELADETSFPHLIHIYDAWLESKGDVLLWLHWVRIVYPDSARENLKLYIESADKEHVTVETLKQFNLDWRRFEKPELWYELPRQSIIVMDECQQTFPPRPVGARVPRHCSEFETHRHKGWDIHLVTQDAKLMDNHVRRLAGCHVHYFNPFKSNRVTRYQADKVFDQEDYFQKKNTIRSIITRDKSLYGLYWSADAHTHKLVLPKKLILVLFVPLLIGVLVWYLLSGSWASNTAPQQSNQTNTAQPSQPQTQQPAPDAYIPTNEPAIYDQIKPFSAVPADTPIGQLCDSLTYAGYELKTRYNRPVVEHFFTCELPYLEDEAKNEENFIKPSLLLDGYYLSNLGFTFEYSNRMPVLSYGNTRYIFPRY